MKIYKYIYNFIKQRLQYTTTDFCNKDFGIVNIQELAGRDPSSSGALLLTADLYDRKHYDNIEIVIKLFLIPCEIRKIICRNRIIQRKISQEFQFGTEIGTLKIL